MTKVMTDGYGVHIYLLHCAFPLFSSPLSFMSNLQNDGVCVNSAHVLFLSFRTSLHFSHLVGFHIHKQTNIKIYFRLSVQRNGLLEN